MLIVCGSVWGHNPGTILNDLSQNKRYASGKYNYARILHILKVKWLDIVYITNESTFNISLNTHFARRLLLIALHMKFRGDILNDLQVEWTRFFSKVPTEIIQKI